jgi:DNA-binding winged helix-turn-helix (wHTH) protein/predicted ATPase
MKYFLSYRFDQRDGSLYRDTRAVGITRKASELLRCLIDRAGTVVTHEAILSAVWPDAHVQPENIKVLVRELRRALDDDPHQPRYIRTENGRGYAFIASLQDSPGSPDGDGSGPRRARVNRPHHLTSLADALEDAAHAKCMVVVIEGERGIGKTALCEAFMEYAAAQPSVRLCYGQSLPGAGPPPPYSTIGDALQHLIRHSPTTIEPQLARHAPHWLERLRARGAFDASPAPDPLRMALELGSFLEALGEDGPTAIVLDDLQWGDAETIRLIQALARRHAPLRTLIVLTCTRLPPTASGSALWRLLMELWSTGRCVMRRLRPLGEEDVRLCLVERFGAGHVSALAPTIHRLTGGNPLALTTVMDALIGGDLASPDPSAFEASLPEDAREAMLWRFAQLETSSRLLLESAAAVGTVFTSDDVAAAAGSEAVSRIEHQLDALCARGFIERIGPTGTGAKRYSFMHPLHAELLASRGAWFDQLHDAEHDPPEIAGPYN